MHISSLVQVIGILLTQLAVSNAFSISLSCNDPCSDLKKDGIPADGIIGATWDGPELRQDASLVFALKWGMESGLSDYGLLYDLKPTDGQSVFVANGSSSLQIPSIYHPPGDQYYIAVYPSNRRDLSQSFGPFKLNDAYSTYPVPTQNSESNFTVTLEHPQNSTGSDDGNTTYHLGQEITVKWTDLPRNVTFNLTAVHYYWGNPATYGGNTSWNGNMGKGDGPAVDYGKSETPFILDEMSYPPPGDGYYIGVLLGNGIRNSEYAMEVKVTAYAGPITIAQNSSSSTDEDTTAPPSLGSVFTPALYTTISGFLVSVGVIYCAAY